MRRLLPLLLLAALPLTAASDRLQAFLKVMGNSASSPEARADAVRALASSWDEEATKALLAAVKPSQAPEALVAITEVAAKHPDEGATAMLKACLGIKEAWRARGSAALALVKRGRPGDFELACGLSTDKDGRALQLLCEALGMSDDPKAVEALGPLLAHEDWRVRASAIAALGQPRKDKKAEQAAVQALIARLDQEKGRLVGDILDALKALTGQELGPDPKPWNAWRITKRDGGQVLGAGFEEAKTSRPPPVSYHGVKTYSRRIIFVFDRTGSMQAGDHIGKEKKHLVETIEALAKSVGLDAYEKKPAPVSFNIIMFAGGTVECWKDALVPATEENRASAITFVNRQQASGWTNTWDAMKTALDMATKGVKPPRKPGRGCEAEGAVDPDTEPYGYGKALLEGADTIFLLSDGVPSTPDGKPADWTKVAEQIRDYNRNKRIVIHTVGVGEAFDVFMRRVAEESGGTFTRLP